MVSYTGDTMSCDVTWGNWNADTPITSTAWYSWNSANTNTQTTVDPDKTWQHWNYEQDRLEITGTTNTGMIWNHWVSCKELEQARCPICDLIGEPTTYTDNNTVYFEWSKEADEQVEKIKHTKAERRRLKLVAEQQRKDDLKRERAEKRRTKIELRKKFKAEHKAMELLTDLLEPDQIEVYKRTGRVLVKGNEFDWLIERYKQYGKDEFAPYDNVHIKKIKSGKIHDLCVSQRKQMELPTTDRVIGFALMAKANEKAFDKEANVLHINDYQEKEAAVM